MMKKIKSFKGFALGLSMLGFILGSCSSDDNSSEILKDPVKVEDVVGDYEGKMIVLDGEEIREVALEVSVVDSLINFVDFPVEELKGKLVETEVLSVAVLEEEVVEKVAYSFGVEPKLTEHVNLLELILSPEPLIFQVQDGEDSKEVEVEFAIEESGLYDNMKETLSFEIFAKSIKVNGEEQANTLSVSYKVVSFLKR